MPEFRQDPITGRCVIIASNRSTGLATTTAKQSLRIRWHVRFAKVMKS